MSPAVHLNSRFASIAEATSEPYAHLNRTLAGLNAEFNLPDHAELNRTHYPWAIGLFPGSQLYGSRLWEYPFAILAADLQPGMACADVGCGRTPFTVYLSRHPGIQVTGFDPDVGGDEKRTTAFGVNADFVRRTGLDIRPCGMVRLEAPDNHFDRVFCLSVIEHLDAPTARAGLREMARILKPGGRLIVTMDVAIHETTCDADPLSLIWESGLLVAGEVDLRWPRRRLGIGYHGGLPADVYGMVLEKSAAEVESRYAEPGAAVPAVASSAIPALRQPRWVDPEPLAWPRRLRQAWDFVLHGNRPKSGRGVRTHE